MSFHRSIVISILSCKANQCVDSCKIGPQNELFLSECINNSFCFTDFWLLSRSSSRLSMQAFKLALQPSSRLFAHVSARVFHELKYSTKVILTSREPQFWYSHWEDQWKNQYEAKQGQSRAFLFLFQVLDFIFSS